MSNKDKIRELEEELKRVSKKDKAKEKLYQEKAKIRELKAKIREKKYAGVRRVAKNLKTIGGAVGKRLKPVGKALLGVGQPQKAGKQRSMNDIISSLPQ